MFQKSFISFDWLVSFYGMSTFELFYVEDMFFAWYGCFLWCYLYTISDYTSAGTWMLVLVVWVQLWLSFEVSISTGCFYIQMFVCPVGWSCRIHWPHLCRGVSPPPKKKNECPGYDTEQSDGEVPEMLGPWGMRNNLSLPLIPGPF